VAELFCGEPSEFLTAFVDPWYKSLKEPEASQLATMRTLVDSYAQTNYGREHAVREIDTIIEFRRALPIFDYSGIQPYFQQVKNANYSAILSEPVVRWVMTRGTTGIPKLLRITQTDVSRQWGRLFQDPW
jgi:phenylacetate-coenzyme A ligase PaaK-like adenylate-forming protein